MKLRQQYLTKNDSYTAGRTIVPKGVMVHSTGSNNPAVCRYVPGNEELGINQYGNHWNRSGLSKSVHAFIGKFVDGSVGTVQTLPWDRRAWHAGRGRKGSANDTHISFEICEDYLTNAAYFHAVYREAVELTAMLCRLYQLDPLEDGVVICHSEGNERGIASNHGDVMHWFPKHGKTMDDFRADVARDVKGEMDVTEAELRRIVREELAAIENERASLPAADWAKTGLVMAKAKGITDGTRPQSAATRQEVAVMIHNALK